VILRDKHILSAFESRMLRRILVPRRDEVIRGLRKQHNERLHKLYSPLNIIRNIKSRRMRLTGYVAGMGRSRSAYKLLW
jgi:hypothetical protein